MTPEKRREIARLGGKAAHEKGRAHQFTPNEAREAGRKGGLSVSRNRQHMAEIGRAGGKARGGGRPAAADVGGASAEVFHFPTQALEQVLTDLSYPASKAQLIERAGDQAITIGEGERRPLRELLQQTHQDFFASFEQVGEEIDRVLRESRAA